MWFLYPDQIGIWKCCFLGVRKKVLPKNPRSISQEPTNSYYRGGTELYLGHTGGRQVLTLLGKLWAIYSAPFSNEKPVSFVCTIFHYQQMTPMINTIWDILIPL